MTAEPHPRRCTAHKSNGDPCSRWAIAGGTTCPAHGGSAPAVKAAAARRVLAQQARAEADAVLAHEGVSSVDNPLETLGKVAAEVLAFKDSLSRRVNALQYGLSTTNSLGTEALKVEVELYERALDRSGKFLDMLVRNGFEGKRVALRESEAQVLVGVVQQILAAARLTPEQDKLARAAAREQFQALAAIEGQATR
ncbi:hypothetical protein GCM10009767_35690 [Kocuria aegyptia]|uniref:DUF222 domain-containing protein n=1 Tax=Kocuria aegyptia TaxID=330943 RepID=A0ABP4X9U5_9MICC